jgi:hypothetical protein
LRETQVSAGSILTRIKNRAGLIGIAQATPERGPAAQSVDILAHDGGPQCKR